MDNKTLLEAIDIIENKFDGFTLENIQLLLEKFEYKEALLYYKISTTKKDSKFLLNELHVLVTRIGIGLKKEQSDNFQLTNHTLFTLLDEYNAKPSDLIKQ